MIGSRPQGERVRVTLWLAALGGGGPRHGRDRGRHHPRAVLPAWQVLSGAQAFHRSRHRRVDQWPDLPRFLVAVDTQGRRGLPAAAHRRRLAARFLRRHRPGDDGIGGGRHQLRPSGPKVQLAVPWSAVGAMRSSTVRPKPLPVGGVAMLMPRSDHLKVKIGVPSCDDRLHSTATAPSLVRNAPYLTALVASS